MVVGHHIDLLYRVRWLSIKRNECTRKLSAHILRRLHSAQACGVVILFAVVVVADLGFSGCSEATGFLGVTPWKVWNMPPWAGMVIVGAMVNEYSVMCMYSCCVIFETRCSE